MQENYLPINEERQNINSKSTREELFKIIEEKEKNMTEEEKIEKTRAAEEKKQTLLEYLNNK